MDVNFFLKQRTTFIRGFFDPATTGFRESQRRIDQSEPPFDDPPRSEDGEPPFLSEWIDAETGAELVAQGCWSGPAYAYAPAEFRQFFDWRGAKAGSDSDWRSPHFGWGWPWPFRGSRSCSVSTGGRMSKVLIVYAHPESRSFNGGMLDVAKQVFSSDGHEFRISDLYAMDFDPVVRATDFKDFDSSERLDYFAEQKRAYASGTLADDIVAEIAKVAWCDLMILQFPLYWFAVPAILKGWIDRVFVPGFAFGGGAWYERGGLVGKRAMLATTMAAYPEMMARDGINGLLDVNLWPIQNGVLAFCGFDVLSPFVATAVPYADASARTALLAAYGRRLVGLQEEAPLAFHRRDEFDRRWKMKPDVEPRTVGHHFAHAPDDVLQRLRQPG